MSPVEQKHKTRGGVDDKKKALPYFEKSCRLSGGDLGLANGVE